MQSPDQRAPVGFGRQRQVVGWRHHPAALFGDVEVVERVGRVANQPLSAGVRIVDEDRRVGGQIVEYAFEARLQQRRERLPRPPADVPQLPETAPEGLTERQLVERHASDPACAKCHQRIDPYGFALEEFDAIRPRARVYEEMRYAAHQLVDKPYDESQLFDQIAVAKPPTKKDALELELDEIDSLEIPSFELRHLPRREAEPTHAGVDLQGRGQALVAGER